MAANIVEGLHSAGDSLIVVWCPLSTMFYVATLTMMKLKFAVMQLGMEPGPTTVALVEWNQGPLLSRWWNGTRAHYCRVGGMEPGPTTVALVEWNQGPLLSRWWNGTRAHYCRVGGMEPGFTTVALVEWNQGPLL